MTAPVIGHYVDYIRIGRYCGRQSESGLVRVAAWAKPGQQVENLTAFFHAIRRSGHAIDRPSAGMLTMRTQVELVEGRPTDSGHGMSRSRGVTANSPRLILLFVRCVWLQEKDREWRWEKLQQLEAHRLRVMALQLAGASGTTANVARLICALFLHAPRPPLFQNPHMLSWIDVFSRMSENSTTHSSSKTPASSLASASLPPSAIPVHRRLNGKARLIHKLLSRPVARGVVDALMAVRELDSQEPQPLLVWGAQLRKPEGTFRKLDGLVEDKLQVSGFLHR
ncbi:uncharacterized protein BXZ73DRAFT_78899 [Epithele typhae]|uniref:uncharacterized protein n=1 Tax=Epithele typhae TaxID=378194 RepID=UPI00200801C9|nr:uncharacterized protein BXZ73DRAFT_78899 [Epithele typhae]KAH9925920.1 hypothetical protein BXZ73DRAFT_78899 [Epithele typhae]